MYEAFYGLSRHPFSATPSVENYFPAESIEQARQSLIRGVERSEGVGMFVGPAGTGKTLLCQVLADYFRDRLRVVLLTNAPLSTRRALLQSILFELRLPFRNLEEGELRLALMDHLDAADACPSGMLLILDEAHTAPLRILEELRLITNLVRDGEPRVHLILAGSSLLEEHLAHPRLESFNQRVGARCYLHPFHRQEVARYIRQAIDRVEGDADALFSDDAYRNLARITDGIPRLVNQVCDHALLLASSANARQIDSRQIDEAWADLQRLPVPSSVHAGDSPDETHEGTIEFGPLDESVPATPPPDITTAELIGTEERELVTERIELLENGTHPFEELVADEVQRSSLPVEDPFGGPFEEEEVVIDRFVTWDLDLRQTRPRVTSDESHEIAAALATLDPTTVTDSATDDASTLQPAADDTAKGEPPSGARPSNAAHTKGDDIEHQLARSAFTLSQLVQRGFLGTSELLAAESPYLPPTARDMAFFPPIITLDTLHALPGTPSFNKEVLADLQWWDAVPPSPPENVGARAGAIGLWAPHSHEGDDRDIILIDEETRTDGVATERPRASRQEYRRLFGLLRRRP